MSDVDAMSWSLLLVSWGVVLALGLAVSVYAVRAYRRNRTRGALGLAGGLLILSVGTTASWWGVYLVSDDLVAAQLVCTGALATGFAALVYSLRTRFG